MSHRNHAITIRMPLFLIFLLKAVAYKPLARQRKSVSPLRSTASSVDEFVEMKETYERLASRVVNSLEGRQEPIWICVAGGPGSGKSTLTEAVVRCCKEMYKVPSVVLPMDGFHYSKAELCRLDPPNAASFLPRRGAPHTFDAEGFYNALKQAKYTGAAQLPTYSRELSDPVPGGAVLEPSHRIIFVEGNYLLLGALSGKNEDLKTSLLGDEETEAARWRPLLPLFDETWFVAPPKGIQEQRRRLVERHLETWSAEKTAMWRAATAREGAEKRTNFNDIPNAHLCEKCREHADVVIDSI